MTNYEALIEAIEELEKIEHLPNEVQQNVYLASIAQSLARLADAIEQKGAGMNEREYINAVLNEIRTEIKSQIHEEYIPCTGGYVSRTIQADVVLKIIDKYTAESENKE